MHLSRHGLQVAATLVAVLGISCTCGKPPLKQTDACLGVEGAQADHPDACGDTNECGNHFTCRSPDKARPDLKCCLFADRTCNTEADCCPGQTCPADRKKCFDKYVSCEKDADCGDRGDKFCEVYTDNYGSTSRCRFKPCSAQGTCPDGQSCFQGDCMADLPCNGSCESGKACVATIDRCQDYASPEGRPEAACPVTCNTGFIATFKDGRNIWDSCTLTTVQCLCAELPGLHSNDLGRFSAVDADPGKTIFASAYDGQYGDLVVVRYGLDGTKQGTDYVDGVPTGTVKYGPSGARGGIAEPGPDVGRYTDVVVNNGQVYVSYYDATNGDLKVAVRGTDGKWSSHKVDGIGDVGLYTSIAVDSDGLPGISYFMKAADETFAATDCPGGPPTGERKYLTALKFARATSATPKTSGDWQIRTIACLNRPPPACDGCTATCADPGSGPACLPAATGCANCTGSTDVCVTSGGAPKCSKKYNPSALQDVPMGVGMFSSMVFNGKEPIIAYMQRTVPTGAKVADGDLYAVRLTADNNLTGAPVAIESAGDTGYFPSVKIDPTSKAIAIAFHNFSSKTFKFYYAPTLTTGVALETIDTGVDAAHPGEQGLVGTDSALIMGSKAGDIWAVYQDATRGDLKVAKRAITWVPQTVVTNGAVGFFADGLVLNNKLYATHAKIHARVIAGEPQVDNSLLLEQLTPP